MSYVVTAVHQSSNVAPSAGVVVTLHSWTTSILTKIFLISGYVSIVLLYWYISRCIALYRAIWICPGSVRRVPVPLGPDERSGRREVRGFVTTRTRGHKCHPPRVLHGSASRRHSQPHSPIPSCNASTHNVAREGENICT